MADQPRCSQADELERGCGRQAGPGRAAAGPGSADGQPRWTAPFLLPRRYLAKNCDLAYATTCHAAQGRTVDTAHVLVDGRGDRQGLYVAMSRGREGNYAYCVTGFPRSAQTGEGTRAGAGANPCRTASARTGRPARLTRSPAATPVSRRRSSDPVAVMAAALHRDGGVLSATETLRAELSRADHLGVLGSIWQDLARQAQARRFERALRDRLPPELAAKALDDKARTWLWRSLREAEAAGLDGGEVLRRAAASWPLDDAVHVARVIDHRARQMLEGTEPALPGSWRDQVPVMGDPDLDRYMRELADGDGRPGPAAGRAHRGNHTPVGAAGVRRRTRRSGGAGGLGAPRVRGRGLPGDARLRTPGRRDRPRAGQDLARGAGGLARGAGGARPHRGHRPARPVRR